MPSTDLTAAAKRALPSWCPPGVSARRARDCPAISAVSARPAQICVGDWGSPASRRRPSARARRAPARLPLPPRYISRSEEHTSELQSPCNLVCRLLLEKKKKYKSLVLLLSARYHSHFYIHCYY